jgi:hypothetical protein
MAYVVVQGLCKIFKYGTGSHLSVLKVVHSESLKVTDLEMSVKLLTGKIIGENPIFQLTQAVSGTERLTELLAAATLYEHLLRRKVGKQLVYMVGRALGYEIFTGRYVKE